jgi:hypothetical protein
MYQTPGDDNVAIASINTIQHKVVHLDARLRLSRIVPILERSAGVLFPKARVSNISQPQQNTLTQTPWH